MAVHLRAVAVKTWRSVLRILLLLLITLALMVSMLLGTEGGRIALVKQGLNAWQLFSQQKIELVGLRSAGLGQWQVGQVRISGIAAAPLVQISGLELQWRWRYALQNRWWLSSISADTLHIELSQPKSSEGEQFSQLYRNWTKIPAIRIERLNVAQLSISRPRYPDLTAELNGHAELNWGAMPARLLLGLTQADSQNQYAAQLSAAAIDQIRLQGSLYAEAHSSWARWLKWSLDEPAIANWDVTIDYAQQGRLKVAIDDWTLPWQGHQLKAQGQVDYDVADIRLEFAPLTLTLDEQPAQLAGWLQARDSQLDVAIGNWPIEPFARFFGHDELSGRASIDAQWLGGWQQPRLQGQLNAAGSWQGYPYSGQMTSSAGLSSINITQAQLQFANNALAVTGSLDWLSEELEFELTGQLATDPLLRSYIPPALADVSASAQINAQLSGRYTQPKLSAQLQAQGRWRDEPFKLATQAEWQQSNLQFQQLNFYSSLAKFEGDLTADLSSQQWQSDLAIAELRTELLQYVPVSLPVDFSGSASGKVQLTGQGSDFSSRGKLNLLGRWQQWPLNANLDIAQLDETQLSLTNADIRLGPSDATLKGRIDFSQGQLDLALNHQQWPLATLPPWFAAWPQILTTLEGQWTGQTQLSGYWRKPAISTTSQLQGSWFGEPLSLALTTQPQDAEQWQVPQFDLQWLGSDWRYQGSFRPYELLLDGQVQLDRLTVDNLPLLSREFTQRERSLPESMALALTTDMAITGKMTAPQLTGAARIEGLVDQQPFDMQAEVTYLDSQMIDLASASGRWADGQWQLQGRYQWLSNLWDMNIATDTADTAYLVPWLSLALEQKANFAWLEHWSGSLRGQMQINNIEQDWQISGDLLSDGELYGDAYRLHWQGEGQLRQALNHQITSQWGVAELSAELISDAQSLNGALQARSLSYQQIRQIIPAVPQLMSGVLNAQIDISGAWQNPDLAVELSTQGQIDSATAHRFKADVQVQGTADNWRIKQATIEIPTALTASVSGRGQYLQGQLELQGELPDTRYWFANEELGLGQAEFNLQANGQLSEPELFGQLTWRARNWPIVLTASLDTQAQHYLVEAALYSQDETRLKSTLKVAQTPFSSWPSQWQSQPLEFLTVINTPLTVLDPLFSDQPDIELAGLLSGQLLLTGSLQSPLWQGELNWQNGRFEHARYGTLVNDISFLLTGEQRQWQLTGTANDGRRGVISLAGAIDFIHQQQNPLQHQIDLDIGFGNAHLLNQAQMDAGISGALNLAGSYHQLAVVGDLFVNPLTLQTDTFLWDGAPQLNIVSDETEARASDSRPVYWPDGQWQVRLIAENRVNLYGQGISAELKGELALSENLYQPEIAGRFDLVRGTYAGLGRVFVLDSGSVQIQNNQLVLDIQGSHTAKMQLNNQLEQLPIVLRIQGNQDQLNLQLSTSADLDQDEILAQLLFGKIVAELDVVQAVQLANVINKLRTGNSGFDIIGATRDSFDLDSLVIDTNSDEEGNLRFNVSAGKYLNDFLYLEVEQDVGSDLEIRGSLQYQVTPNTNIELYTQGNGGQFEDSGVELNWSWDY